MKMFKNASFENSQTKQIFEQSFGRECQYDGSTFPYPNADLYAAIEGMHDEDILVMRVVRSKAGTDVKGRNKYLVFIEKDDTKNNKSTGDTELFVSM